MSYPYIVGITGGSGSGKSYFLERLMAYFSRDEICLVAQDNYYRRREEQPVDEQGVINFDLPESIDDRRFYADLMELRSGNTVRIPEYTYNNPNLPARMLEFKPAPIILVEGILVLHYPQIRALFDLTLFIEARETVKLRRRILRDEAERGYDLQDVLYRYEKHVTPIYERYIAPHKHDVDIVVPNNDRIDRALDVVAFWLKSRMDRAV
jgi:uridine kinase